MILEIFPGNFTLPSIDLDCLYVATYCRISNVKVELVERTSPFSYQLPALKIDSQIIHGAENIIKYLNDNKLGADSKLTEEDAISKLDIWSLKTSVIKRLDPCLIYLWWYSNDNYDEFLGPWISSQFSFPHSLFCSYRIRRGKVAKLLQLFPRKTLESDSRDFLLKESSLNEAREFLNMLGEKLSTNKGFLGDKLTSLDALLFSYLSLLSRVPCKNELIKHHIGAIKQLDSFVNRNSKTLFAEYASRNDKSPFKTFQSDEHDDIKWSSVAFSGACVSLLMLVYAASTGVINLKNEDDD